MEQIKNKWVNGFIIGTFVSLYLLVSIISTIHVIDFFELSNPKWLAVSLAIGFELGAAASLAALITLDKMNKTLVWALFIVITLMQMQGNMYYAFINMADFQSWSELFNLIEEEPLYQKRVLSFVSGAILPLVALGFIKSLVDYIKPADTTPVLEEQPVEKKSSNAGKVDSTEEWDNTLEDGLEEEEWDEEHALDMVLNDMVETMDKPQSSSFVKNEGMSDEDAAAWNKVAEDLAKKEYPEARGTTPPSEKINLVQKQESTNIPAAGLVNPPVEITRTTLEGTGPQRKIKVERKKEE